MILGLFVILVAVLILPFSIKKIEHNLEIFLFVMGVAASLISRQMSGHLAMEALKDPLPITAAVLIFGLLFKWSRSLLDSAIQKLLDKIPVPVFVFFLILILGLASSIITAIIASLVLVEVISMLKLDKQFETRFVIIACFAIGLGAALTPIGEPLATIAIAKLKSWPDVNFWYLIKLLGVEVIVGVFALSILSLFFHGKKQGHGLTGTHREENYKEIIVRTIKVYFFVMALVFLGQGFKPVIDIYLVKISGDVLYWINMISAILDNATITAAEIGPTMTPIQIKKLLMGLLIAGGMLIPGNIPNIVAASKLKIASKEWAKLGVPLGLILMLLFFFVLEME
ncbi:MAG: cation transporter [Deltaproteobacteria bacterium RIFCSPLOWO2_02_FULL_46_8]|nr:MAG: cation transporter [Deltaproteobacteria bacterium RIFCSPLOWO2_02_FULL_46_8]